MTKDPKLYLVFIAEAIERIERHKARAAGPIWEDELVFDAIVRNLQTLAEAT